MKITFMVFAILFVITAAQMQKINPNDKLRTEFNFDPSKIHDMFPEYQRIIIDLRNATIDMLKSVGYNLASVKATLKAAITARRAIKMCYNTKPIEEFHKCAEEKIEKARLDFGTIEEVDHKIDETTKATETKLSHLLGVISTIPLAITGK